MGLVNRSIAFVRNNIFMVVFFLFLTSLLYRPEKKSGWVRSDVVTVAFTLFKLPKKKEEE
jgi:hypothetical protein